MYNHIREYCLILASLTDQTFSVVTLSSYGAFMNRIAIVMTPMGRKNLTAFTDMKLKFTFKIIIIDSSILSVTTATSTHQMLQPSTRRVPGSQYYRVNTSLGLKPFHSHKYYILFTSIIKQEFTSWSRSG